MKSKKKLVKEYIQKIISKLCYEYGTSLEDARKAVEELDLLNRYKGNYDFVLYQNVSTWVNLIVNKRKANKHKKEVEREDVERENLKNKTTANHILVYTKQPTTKNTKAGDVVLYNNEVWINDGHIVASIPSKNVDEEVEETLKEFRPNRMDVQIYNKVFLPQWTTASLFIRNLQRTLEDKCDKESLRQLQIIGWNEETKKFISDVLNLYKENVLNELRDNVSNKPEKKEENTMENYIVINGKKEELTEEQLNYLCMFNRFAQMAKEQFGLTITPKETAGETFKTLFGVDFSDCSERNNPFNSELKSGDNYFIVDEGVKTSCYEPITGKHRLNSANSFNDKDFAKQVYLHELLNRKLLKYAYDNEAEDCSEWDCENLHYHIIFSNRIDKFFVGYDDSNKYSNIVYFSNSEVAEQAIEDVVKPFIKEHPEFVW